MATQAEALQGIWTDLWTKVGFISPLEEGEEPAPLGPEPADTPDPVPVPEVVTQAPLPLQVDTHTVDSFGRPWDTESYTYSPQGQHLFGYEESMESSGNHI